MTIATQSHSAMSWLATVPAQLPNISPIIPTLRDLWLSLSAVGIYIEPTTSTSVAIDFVTIPFPTIAGSTTEFTPTDLYETPAIVQNVKTEKNLISYAEALRLETVNYERLVQEINESYQAEAKYWQLSIDEDK
jgi:hypothetical protein